MYLLIVFSANDKPFFVGVFKNSYSLLKYSNGFIKKCDLYNGNKIRINKSIKQLIKIYKLPKNIK